MLAETRDQMMTWLRTTGGVAWALDVLGPDALTFLDPPRLTSRDVEAALADLGTQFRTSPSADTARAWILAAYGLFGVEQPDLEIVSRGESAGWFWVGVRYPAAGVTRLGSIAVSDAAAITVAARAMSLNGYLRLGVDATPAQADAPPRLDVPHRLREGVAHAMAMAPRRRLDGASISPVFDAFLGWVEAQPDAAMLRAEVERAGGQIQGWIGDEILLTLLRESAKEYKDPTKLNPLLVGESWATTGAVDYDDAGNLIRVPTLPGEQTGTVPMIYAAGTQPAVLLGVPAFKVVDLLHERVDLTALSGPTRRYLRAYLAAYGDDEDDVGLDDEGALSTLAVAIESIPLTTGGRLGLEDLREQAIQILGREWVDHPIAKAIAAKQAALNAVLNSESTPIEVIPDEVEEPRATKPLPQWAAGFAPLAESAGDILARHGQGALELMPLRLNREGALELRWQGGGRRLVVNIRPAGEGYHLWGDFTGESGQRVTQSRWSMRRRSANLLLPDAWLDRIREVAPAQVALVRFESLDLTPQQRAEVRKLLRHARDAGLDDPEVRVDEHNRIFLTGTHEGVASTVVVPPSAVPFPWDQAPRGRRVRVSETRVAPPTVTPERRVDPKRRVEVVEALRIKSRTIRARSGPKPGEFPGVQRHLIPDWEDRGAQVYAALRDVGYRLGQFLGCGVYGCAYLGRPYVVKITGDPLEVANARVVQEANADGSIEGVSNIYAVFAVADEPDLYAIVSEVLRPIPRDVARWINEWRLDIERLSVARGDSKMSTYKQRVREALADAPDSVDVRPYIEAIDKLYALGVEYQDGHSDNVMMREASRKGEKPTLVAIDLGYAATPGAKIYELA